MPINKDPDKAGLNSLGRTMPDRFGREIFEIQPIVLGGSPTDPANKTLLTREQHIAAVRYWNQIVKKLRGSRS
ncbi:MAG: hypothetical protein NTY38_26940 [Acidobacteria bacterium]|nr:hypothetical protein [Acidobacteriota bacterium]